MEDNGNGYSKLYDMKFVIKDYVPKNVMLVTGPSSVTYKIHVDYTTGKYWLEEIALEGAVFNKCQSRPTLLKTRILNTTE